MGRQAPGEPAQIILAERRVSYRLQRSARRRTVVLTVDPERGLVVYCPQRLARRSVEEILRNKARWILEKTAQVRTQRRPALTCAPGRPLPWRGAWYPLAVTANGRRRELALAGGTLRLGLPARVLNKLRDAGLHAVQHGGLAATAEAHPGPLPEPVPEPLPEPLPESGPGPVQLVLGLDGGTPAAEPQAAPAPLHAPPEALAALREQVLAGYREAARGVLEGRVAHFAPALGVRPRVVRIKEQRRRWGSASAKGALNFNWRLILAPPEVLDYVVVHELCHLLELNHSPRFWARVAAVLPDYRTRQAWLREHGPGLYDL